jgi:hypothetical protein
MTLYMRASRILRRLSVGRIVLLVCVLFAIFDVCQVLRSRAGPVGETRPAARRSERIYIASIHWNNEQILRSHWSDAVVDLARALGRENIFITVYESGSWDGSKAVLRDLDATLEANDIRRNITLSNVTHKDEMSVAKEHRAYGWIDIPGGRKELRRTPYLSRLRNWTLQPLLELSRQGEKFDKVLFLNDNVVSVCFGAPCLEGHMS